MLNIQPDTAKGKNDGSGPSNAQLTTSPQNLQTKVTQNNGPKEKTPNPNNQPIQSNPINAVNEMSAIMGYLQMNGEAGNVNIATPKSNSKKTQRKPLHVSTKVNGFPEANRSAPIPMSPGINMQQNLVAFYNNTGYVSTSSTSSSSYAPNTSRYQSNMSHHSQIQYMQNLQNAIDIQQAFTSIALQNMNHAMSAPNTPYVHNFQQPGSASIPCSPLMAPQSNMPFFQNMMQHPLLNHTFNFNQSPNSAVPNNIGKGKQLPSKDSPKQQRTNKNNEKDTNPEDRKFEFYLSIDEVEKGLKDGTLFEGVLRINPKQFLQGFISTNDRDEQDMYIDGIKNRNRALEGDIVVVQIVESVDNNKEDNKTSKGNVAEKKKTKENKGKDLKSPQAGKQKEKNKSPMHKAKGKNKPEKHQHKRQHDSRQNDHNILTKSQEDIQIGQIEQDNEQKIVAKTAINYNANDIALNRSKEIEHKLPTQENEMEGQNEDKKHMQKDQTETVEENQKEQNYTEDEKEKKQKRGKVVYIKERVHPRTVVGNLKLMPDKNRQKALFVPRDHRVPRLNIPFSCWPDNFYQDAKKYEDTVFLAKIIDWFDTRFAIGKILSNVGQAGDMETETKAILAQNDLDVTPFGPEVRDLFPRLDYVIPNEEITLREDCRNLCIFSIDPSNCRDIDDAISCRELKNGNYEVGVHISDVAHYLTEDTALDHKVSQKATTIYLVEKAYHMLPDELCMLCSLFPGVDKLAFSVFWEITNDGEVLHHRFAKTVINSCAQLSYDHAQAILDDRDDAANDFPETYEYGFKDIEKSIKIVGKLAAIFRKTRFEGGALRIDQPKVSFRLSTKDGLPESYSIYEIRESNQLIEEFMLLANMTVARRLFEDFPRLAFLRCHPPPSGHMLRALEKSLKPLGIQLDISSAGNLHRSLLSHTGPGCSDIGKAMVLNMLCAKPMTRAKYFCADGCQDEDFHHYALNVPLYTHFTSPIRRYADIMVHRLLAASLNYRDTPTWEVDRVRSIAAQCNKQKYNAKRAGEMSSELYMLRYIEMHSPVETTAVVVEVREKYIDVIIAAMGLNRRIFFNNDFPGEFNCVKHEGGSIKMSKMEITWKAEGNKAEVKQVIETFSILQILMVKGKEERLTKVETKLVRPDK